MAAFAESTPCWVDVSLPDLAAGKRFYGELFGWTFGEDSGAAYGHYTEAFSDGRRVAGLVAKKDGRMPTVWGVYFATSDAVGLSERIVRAGGRTVRAPTAVGPFGVMAQARTRPARSSGSGSPGRAGVSRRRACRVPSAGPSSIRATRSASTRSTRRSSASGGPICPAPPSTSAYGSRPVRNRPRPVGSSARPARRRGRPAPKEGRPVRNRRRPGRRSADGASSRTRSSWRCFYHFLVYFAVSDCDTTAGTVVRLGGRITTPPFDIEHGRMAAVMDNQGAVFAVLAERERPRAPVREASESGSEPVREASEPRSEPVREASESRSEAVREAGWEAGSEPGGTSETAPGRSTGRERARRWIGRGGGGDQ